MFLDISGGSKCNIESWKQETAYEGSQIKASAHSFKRLLHGF